MVESKLNGFRYRAFISYSHRDEVFCARLHRRLETYRPPRKAFADSEQNSGSRGRIRPVFRDQDELASSDSLSSAIETALDESEVLIVLCSPASAQSRWVNEEIAYFRRNYPERKVFPIVIDGDPGANPRENPQTAAFAEAMLLADIDDPDGLLGEPLAADARKEADGFTIAFLKLVAAILDVPFDRLRQRDLRRRQRRLAFALVATTALSATLAVMAWRATVARDEAREARAQAELELLSERQTRTFLLSVFQLADPGEARGNTVTVREVLDRAVARIDSTEFARPVIKARFLATMGQAYSSLGILNRSVELLQQSLDELPDIPETRTDQMQASQARLELADVYFYMGEYEQSLAMLDQVEQAESDESLDPESRAYAANIRGDVLSYLEQDAEALENYQQALTLAAENPMTDEQSASVRHRALGGIAILHHFAGDFALAQSTFKEAVDIIFSTQGEMHPDSIWALLSWGSAAWSNGDTETAEQAWTRSLAIATTVLGDSHPEVGTIKNNLGRLYLDRSEFTRAEPMFRDALTIDRTHRSENLDDLAFPLTSLALTRMAQGDFAEARELLEEARSVSENTGHRMLGPVLTYLADIDCEEGHVQTGAANAELAAPITLDEYGEDNWYTHHARLVQAWCQLRAGLEPDAQGIDLSVDVLIEHWGDDSYFSNRARDQLREISTQK